MHPQFWPPDLDYAGKKVVVIGSGATAVTLVPAMAQTAAHVTMLQRSPTYILAMPSEDGIANGLRKLLGTRRGYAATRWKNVAMATLIYRLSRRKPDMIRGWIRKMAIKQLPAGYDVDTHFKPAYNPWDQRLCLVPDGDLFRAITAGHASVATGRIATFTEGGPRLESGTELEADIVVTATGLQLLALGGIELIVDGTPVRLPETMAYKGMMLSGVPNFAFTIGYTNASWTLKADLVSEFVCRLLKHMDARGYDTCVPVNDDPSVTEQPLLDFAAGYVLRSIDQFPKAGSRAPWRLAQNYARDVVTLRHGKIDDGSMRFTARISGRHAAGGGAGTAPRSVKICLRVTNGGAETLRRPLAGYGGPVSNPGMPLFRFRTAAVLLGAGAALLGLALPAQARALPVNYDFALGALAGLLIRRRRRRGRTTAASRPPPTRSR